MKNELNKNPKTIFILDGLGALLSAFLLGVVLVKLERFFEIPKEALYILAIIPCVFAIYDLYCWLFIKKGFGKYLKIIAYANLLYCFLSLAMAIYHYQVITYLGWIYIIIEIAIILFIVKIEIQLSNTTQ